MKIGISGPVSTASVRDLIEGDVSKLPKGPVSAPFLGTLIKALVKRGHQVSVYTLDDTLPPDELNPIIATGQNFKIYYGPCRKHSVRFNYGYLGRSMDFFYREIKALRIAIDIDQPDIVHGHWVYEFGLPAIYSNRPYVVTCHDSPLKVIKYMPNYYRFGRLLMALFAFRKAKNLTAVSPYLKSEIERLTTAEISVIPNPTPVEDIKDAATDFEVSLDLSAPKIVMVGVWDKLKNPKPAMQAFYKLLVNKPRATLHLFGYGFEAGGGAQNWAKSHNLDRNMFFYGPKANAEILVFLEQATLLLHPSLEECCPLTLIEAMSYGLPVIGGSKSGGVPWVLDYGNAGILTDVSMPSEMAKKMQEVLDDKALYLKFREQAKQRIQHVFAQDQVAKAYEGVYLKILNNVGTQVE